MTSAVQPLSTAYLVERLARSFNAAHLGDHGVASPLGLWLLLALVAPAATGGALVDLVDVLGTGAEDAARRAAELLGDPHPAVAAAVAVWAQPELLDAFAFEAWASMLPPSVGRGDVPDPAEADRWAAEHTMGLIEHFPMEIHDLTAVVLASALASRVTWVEPFADAPASELGGKFEALVGTALKAPPGHRCLLAETAAAGVVGVHAADSHDGLCVVSVIAAPDVAPDAVHRAAAEAAGAVVGGDGPMAAVVDLFDLPLGEGHAWSLTERRAEVTSMRDAERVDALLAPWTAASVHDLGATPGVAGAFAAVETFLAAAFRPAAFSALQTAVATYTSEGFEAAAITEIAARGGPPVPRTVTCRQATLRFNRPYAVLAVARSAAPDLERGWGTVQVAGPAWDGLGVFSAWVARCGP